MLSKWLRWGLQVVLLCAVSWAHAGSYEDFFSAIERDDGASISALMARGFDPNSRNPEGQVGLFLALQKESFGAVAALMKSKDVSIDIVNTAGETPLMMAALKGQLEWTRQILLRGAKVNKAGWTALHYAASGPEPAVLSLLLDNGALINAESPNGTTPLMMAARYGTEGHVRVLTARQADGLKKNQQGLNAADFARQSGRDQLAKAIELRYR